MAVRIACLHREDARVASGPATYGYDLAGRITSRGGTLFQSVLPQAVANAGYDLANRLTTRTAAGITVTPAWHLNGNLTSDGLRTYRWDARNRLTAIQGVATYAYDTFGRRRAVTVGTPAKAYLYDGSDIVQEQQGGAPSANLLTGAGFDERFTRATTAADATGGLPATSTTLTDALGTTVALATAAGTVATNYGYDPYGVPGITGAANDNPYQFTGRENDGTRLLYNRARYYNPAWGRFISEDPIGLKGGINRYAYANGNPVSLRDPSGLLVNPLPGGLPDTTPATSNSGVTPAQSWLPLLEPPPEIVEPPLENYPTNPLEPPGEGYQWRGRPGSQPGDKEGNYYNPDTGETLRPDLDHPPPIDPHWDYRAPSGKWYRWFPDGTLQPSVASYVRLPL